MASPSNYIPSQRYAAMVRELPICTVDIVVLRPNRKQALLGRRANKPAKNAWFTIGGRLKKNETLLKAAIRHLRTELGIRTNAKALRLIGVQDEIFSDSAFGSFSTHNVNVFFRYFTSHNRFTVDAQHTEVAWMPVASSKIHPYAKRKIALALKP